MAPAVSKRDSCVGKRLLHVGFWKLRIWHRIFFKQWFPGICMLWLILDDGFGWWFSGLVLSKLMRLVWWLLCVFIWDPSKQRFLQNGRLRGKKLSNHEMRWPIPPKLCWFLAPSTLKSIQKRINVKKKSGSFRPGFVFPSPAFSPQPPGHSPTLCSVVDTSTRCSPLLRHTGRIHDQARNNLLMYWRCSFFCVYMKRQQTII